MISVAHNLESSVFRAPTAKEALTAARASLERSHQAAQR